MLIGSRRGQHKKREAEENRIAVWDHFMKNPRSTIKQAATACGIGVTSTKAHIKAINDGWRPGEGKR